LAFAGLRRQSLLYALVSSLSTLAAEAGCRGPFKLGFLLNRFVFQLLTKRSEDK
jgi:hypothetical protein